jgi:hypothetical protein
MSGHFDRTVQSVIQFAREDAARFRLRDSLRARALAPLLRRHPSAYVEAGMMHYSLWRRLQKKLPRTGELKLKFLDEMALSKRGLKGRLYAPGDLLTLIYIFHPKRVDTDREALLAARALIHSKLIAKTEVAAEQGDIPHLMDEIKCIQTVRRLSLYECRDLFKGVFKKSGKEAKRIVNDFFKRNKG